MVAGYVDKQTGVVANGDFTRHLAAMQRIAATFKNSNADATTEHSDSPVR